MVHLQIKDLQTSNDEGVFLGHYSLEVSM